MFLKSFLQGGRTPGLANRDISGSVPFLVRFARPEDSATYIEPWRRTRRNGLAQPALLRFSDEASLTEQNIFPDDMRQFAITDLRKSP